MTKCELCADCGKDTLATTSFNGDALCADCKEITLRVIEKHPELLQPVECINCGKVGCEDALCKADAQAEEEAQEREDDDTPTTFDYYDDAEALASAGWGTDEDYGYYGGED